MPQFTFDKYTAPEIARKLRSWIDPEKLDRSTIDESIAIASHPKVRSVALMPDVHTTGNGAPNGAVILAEKAHLPLAVGYDQGCGMAVVDTGLTRDDVRDGVPEIMESIKRAVPAKEGNLRSGMKLLDAQSVYPPLHGETRRDSLAAVEQLESAMREVVGDTRPRLEKLAKKHPGRNAKKRLQQWATTIGNIRVHAGTLGGGNHFLELQADERDRVWLMVHSGSRGPGFKTCNLFLALADSLNRAENNNRPTGRLAWIDERSELGDLFSRLLAFNQAFANWNRRAMLRNALTAMQLADRISADQITDLHHNYAIGETHEGAAVIVHRKGATAARRSEPVIIPGSMQTESIIGSGRGHRAAYESCSHGAGRAMSRRRAKQTLSEQLTAGQRFLPGVGGEQVYLARAKGANPIDELGDAYKPFADIIRMQEGELIDVTHRLRPLGVLKG